jgi:single-strand DNA-binding protein
VHPQNENETGFKKNMSRSVASRQGSGQFHVTYAFGRLAEFAGSLARGAHVAIEGELRSHEYQREVVVGDQRTAIPQRVWEIRVDSVLKLDRAAKRESTGDGDQEVPR